MPDVEERLAYLEGRVEEQTHNTEGIREAILGLEQRMDTRFEAVARRLDLLDAKLDIRCDRLDDRMSRQFLWLVGMQVTTLIAIVGALLARS